MQDNNINSFEEIFRNGLDRPAAEGPSQSDWLEMRSLLEKENLIRKKKKRFLFFILFFAIISGITSLLFFVAPMEENGKSTEASAVAVKIAAADLEAAERMGNSESAAIESSPINKGVQVNSAVAFSKPLRFKNKRKNKRSSDATSKIPRSERKTGGAENNSKNKFAAVSPVTHKTPPVDSAKKDSTRKTKKSRIVTISDPGSMLGSKMLFVKKYRKEIETKKWGISVYVAPERSAYKTRTPHNATDNIFVEDTVKHICTTAGLNLSRKLSSRIYLQTGFWYSQKPEVNIERSFAGYSSDVNGSSYRNYYLKYSGKYLEIPVAAKFYSGYVHTLRLYALTGIIAGFNMPGSKSYFIRESNINGVVYRDRINLSPLSIGITGHLAAGLECRLSRRLSIYAEPFYKHGFSPVVKRRNYTGIPVQHRNRSRGVAFGFIYNFNKF